MFTRLKEDYKEGIIRHWRRNMNEPLMVIRIPDGPTETLSDDPHESRFLKDTEEIMAGVASQPTAAPSPKPTAPPSPKPIAPPVSPGSPPTSPTLPDTFRYFSVWIQNPHVLIYEYE